MNLASATAGGSVALVVACVAAPAGAADAGFFSMLQGLAQSTTWEVGAGVDYSTGRYGEASDTTVLSVPSSASVQVDRLRLEASIPYLEVKGPGAYVGGVIIPGSGTSMSNSGVGDATFGASWLVSRDGDVWPALEVAGTFKAPTAASGLGTGKWDYGASLNLYHSFSPKFMLFGAVGYQWLSDFGTFQLENGVTGSAGLNFKPTSDTALGATFDYRAQYFQGLDAQETVSPYALWNFSDHWRVTGYGTIGVTTSSPRIGGGIKLTIFG